MPIPNDILQLVCSYTLTNVDGHNLLSALLVNKEWADVIARLVYREPKLHSYTAFCNFVRTISNQENTIPYADYVRILDTSAINKYDLRRRLVKVISCCHGLVSLSLGHNPASVELDFFQRLIRHCPQLEILQFPDIEKCIFMQEWDFASLKRLRSIELIAAPIEASTIVNVSKGIETVGLYRLSLDNLCLENLLRTHPYIKNLDIVSCKNITELSSLGYAEALKTFKISGLTVTDTTVHHLFGFSHSLARCSFQGTSITDATLQAISNSNLLIEELNLSKCSYISAEGIAKLASAKNFPRRIDVTGCTQIPTSLTNAQANDWSKTSQIFKRHTSQFFKET